MGKRWTHRVGPFLARLFGPLAVRALGGTWRIRLEPPDLPARVRGAGPRVYAFWHGKLLVPAYVCRGTGVVVMISRHADGEAIARIVERLGYGTVRGSSTRGGATALHEAVQRLRDGAPAAFTPDGPRGPRETAQAGAVYAASRAGVPLVPLGVASAPAKVLGSWDRFRIPRPFARVAVFAAAPLSFPADLEGPALEAGCRRLEEALREADARAEALVSPAEAPGR